MKRRDLTPEEQAEAGRLAAAWETFKEGKRHATQAWLAEQTGLGNQSLMYQYLRAKIPLNLTALLAICRVIEADPKAISPRLTGLIGEVNAGESDLTSARTAREQLVLMAYRAGSDNDRTAMDVLAERILMHASAAAQHE
jgi:hypothetical protein